MKRQTLDIGRRHAFCFVQRQRHRSSSYLLLTRSLVADMAVVTVMRCLRAAMGAMQGARITRLAAVTGEVVPGIRTLDIPGSAITAWATAIRMPAIMVTDPVGAMIHIAGIILAGLILSDTGTRLSCA